MMTGTEVELGMFVGLNGRKLKKEMSEIFFNDEVIESMYVDDVTQKID